VATQWKQGLTKKRRKTLCSATPTAIVVSEARNDHCATGGCPSKKPKREGWMLKQKSLQVFTDPENPNHETHDFVA
jgi:hypothetical protein